MKRNKKKANPVVAVLFLVGAGALAVNSMLGLSGGGSTGSGGGNGGDALVVMPDQGDQSGTSPDGLAVEWPDLLAEFGSFDRSTGVRVAFSMLEEAQAVEATPTPAPIGETKPKLSYWDGEDPPGLQLGVVMVSANSRRAVLAGRVVGIDDEVSGVRIHSIERDQVAGVWGIKTLTYDLEDEWPREFRAERRRRTDEAARQEEQGVEPGVVSGNASGVTGPTSINEEYEKALKAQERK